MTEKFEQLKFIERELDINDSEIIFDFFQSLDREHLGKTYSHLKDLFSTKEKVEEYSTKLENLGSRFYGLFENGKMIGGAVLAKNLLPEYFKNDGWAIIGIAHQDYKYMGLSEKVMAWAKEVAGKSELKKIYSNILPDNQAAEKALKKAGFTFVAPYEGEFWYKLEL